MASGCDSIIKGDIDHNGILNEADVDSFLSLIANEDVKKSPCLDLNGDGNINVADVVSLNNCLRYKSGTLKNPKQDVNYCFFPGLTNDLNDTISFEVGNTNENPPYFEIDIRNPYHKVIAFDFKEDRLEIDSIQNLISKSGFKIAFSKNGHVVGLAKVEESVPINTRKVPFLRVYCKNIRSFGFGNIISLINENYERMILPNKHQFISITE